MAAFAINICELIKHPKAMVGVNVHGRSSKLGYLESDFVQHFATKSSVECRGSDKEVCVCVCVLYISDGMRTPLFRTLKFLTFMEVS